MPEAQLREAYEWGDVFVFRRSRRFRGSAHTSVCSRAAILATTNCGARISFATRKLDGFYQSVRQADLSNAWNGAIATAPRLADTVTRIAHEFHPRTWDDMPAT